jgi:RNA polymerase sigma-70 factor (ECF subfamily)
MASDLSRQDVEEICQETFLTVIRKLGAFRGHSSLQTWIFRIAGNKTRDYRERRQAAKRGGGQLVLSLEAEDPETRQHIDPPSVDPGPEAGLLRDEQAMLLGEALDRLNRPCREIIDLRYFGDLTYEEISRELQLNLKTVSSRLSKCLDRLEGIAREVFSRETNEPFSV